MDDNSWRSIFSLLGNLTRKHFDKFELDISLHIRISWWIANLGTGRDTRFENETHVQPVLDINTRDLREWRVQTFSKVIYRRPTFTSLTFAFLIANKNRNFIQGVTSYMNRLILQSEEKLFSLSYDFSTCSTILLSLVYLLLP